MLLYNPSIKKEITLPKLKPEHLPAMAGLIGGSLSTFLLHPLDIMKTRQSVFGGSVMQHLKKNGLFQGVRANILVSGTSWGLYFYT